MSMRTWVAISKSGVAHITQVDGNSDQPPRYRHYLDIVAPPAPKAELENFLHEHVPVLEKGKVIGWEPRSAGIQVTLTGQCTDDLGVPVVVELTGGPKNGKFRVTPSRPCAISLCVEGIRFSETGAAQFSVKALGQMPLTLLVEPQESPDFEPLTVQIPIIGFMLNSAE